MDKFLSKFFPLVNITNMRNDISSYVMLELETLYDNWDRFNDLLRKYPYHGLCIWLQVQAFYNGLNHTTRQMIDAIAKGNLNTKMSTVA